MLGVGIIQWGGRVMDLWFKCLRFNTWQEWQEIFFSRVTFLCWPLFSVHSTPLLPQWHIKDPSHSAKSAGGRLQIITHTFLTQQSWSGLTALFRRNFWTSQGNELTCNLLGNTHPQLSQLAEPLWTDPGIKSGISMCKIISTSKQQQKRRWGMSGQTFSQNPHKGGRSHQRTRRSVQFLCQTGTAENKV